MITDQLLLLKSLLKDGKISFHQKEALGKLLELKDDGFIDLLEMYDDANTDQEKETILTLIKKEVDDLKYFFFMQNYTQK
jgi:hypothetical protein